MEKTEAEILLVEDNQSDAELVMRALKKNNILNKLIHVSSGAEALDYLFGTGAFSGRELTQKPRVILLDLKLPGITGMEVLRTVKSNENTKTIPVVVLTSSREDPDIRECYQLGVNSYVVKPVDFNNFTQAIASLGLYWVLLNNPPDKYFTI